MATVNFIKKRGKFIIDTGSSICVISEKKIQPITGGNLSLLPHNHQVRIADGTFLKTKGTCIMEIQLDHVLFTQEFIVVNIEKSLGILGTNFLDQYEADIKIREKTLKQIKEKAGYINKMTCAVGFSCVIM